jgi:DNA-binding NarL/FixJ family response regulator
MDVLFQIVVGRKNAEIAQHLFLSPKTVQRHVTPILGQLDVGTRQEAAQMAVQRSLGPAQGIESAEHIR